MKKKILAVVMGLLFVADVVMTLFNIDIFTRFLKEKRKINDERIKRARVNGYHENSNDDWSKNLRESFFKKEVF